MITQFIQYRDIVDIAINAVTVHNFSNISECFNYSEMNIIHIISITVMHLYKCTHLTMVSELKIRINFSRCGEISNALHLASEYIQASESDIDELDLF